MNSKSKSSAPPRRFTARNSQAKKDTKANKKAVTKSTSSRGNSTYTGPKNFAGRVMQSKHTPSFLSSTLRSLNDDTTSLQRSFMQVSGVEANSNEIKYRITEFFDIPSDTKIFSYWWNYQQSLTASGSPSADFERSGTAWSRPLKAKLYVLPRSNNAANASSSYAVSTGIPVNENDGASNRQLAGTGCRVIKPDFNVEWTHVASFDYLKTFNTGLVKPAGTDTGGAICLFQAAAVDVDTGDNFDTDVQCMLVLDVAQNVPAMCQVSVGYGSSSTWGVGGGAFPQANVTPQFGLVQPFSTSSMT